MGLGLIPGQGTKIPQVAGHGQTKQNKTKQKDWLFSLFLWGQGGIYQFKNLDNQVRSVKTLFVDFPGGAVVKNPPANAGDTGSSPGPGRSHMPQSN